MRFACWFRRRAETIFCLEFLIGNNAEVSAKVCDRGDVLASTRDTCVTRQSALEQLQSRQILRINNAYRNAVIVNHDQVIDAMAFEQVKDLNGELVFMHRDRVQRHQICDQSLTNLRIKLKMPHEIAMGKNTQ